MTIRLRTEFLQCDSCSGLSSTASLFEGHQLCLDYLVRNLLKLYVDIEFTGSHTQVSGMLSLKVSID
jgi:ubiquitin conjugation factor E4 B